MTTLRDNWLAKQISTTLLGSKSSLPPVLRLMPIAPEKNILKLATPVALLLACLWLGGCDHTKATPEVTTYTVGGTLSGLTGTASAVLFDNGGDALTVSANGAFTFKTALTTGATYAATVGTQPTGETCAVTSGSGTVGTADVTTVSVVCAANAYTIGGTLSGLTSAASVVLLDNGGDALTVSANGAFTFKTALATGAAYAVTVGTQPAGETCAVTGGSGTVATANVTTVTVVCTVNMYTIGGSVSGLTSAASVALLDNGGDALTVSANGAFTFKTSLISGAAYAVTVGTQPTGETCTVTAGSGTVATADVTGVAVACAATSGIGGKGSAYWMPYFSAPSGTVGGQYGVSVIPSGSLASSPAPTYVNTTPSTPLAGAVQYYFDASNNISYSPAVIIYAAVGEDENWHLYGLDLTDPSTTPQPAQITNLSVPPSQQICPAGSVQGDLTTPTSLSALIYIVTPGAQAGEPGVCNLGGGTYELANYSDPATKAPVTVNLPGGNQFNSAIQNDGPFTPLYKGSGALAGVVYFDSTTGTLNLYPDATFATSVPLVSSITSTLVVRIVGTPDGTQFGNEGLFINGYSASGGSLYRIDSSGGVLNVFLSPATGAVTDDNYLFFLTDLTATETDFYEVPLSGVGPTLLYAGGGSTDTAGYGLFGSNNATLVFQSYSQAPSGTITSTLLTVPVEGGTALTPTTIGTYTGSLTAFLSAPTANDRSADLVFVTAENRTTAATPVVTYSSQVLTPGGSVKQALQSNSAFASFGVPLTTLAGDTIIGDVLQIHGITETGGGFGGATLATVNVGTLAGTTVTTTGGAAYTLPVGYVGFLQGFTGSGAIGIGEFLYVETSTPAPPSIGAALDASDNFILPITLTNTNFTAIF